MMRCLVGLPLAVMIVLGLSPGLFATAIEGQKEESTLPNIILLMADDLGYGDTGFNGNEIIRTPNLDRLASQGLVFTHFYAGNSVCSPTRATCLTGRFHDRMGIYTANGGHLPAREITLAEMLKSKGYVTGHFGKWHLGTLSKTISSKGAGRKPELNYSPPWERHYDSSFVTESAIQLWNPGLGNRAKNNPFYENGEALDGEDPSLLGGASRVVVDRVVPFIKDAVAQKKPFLSVVWFHAPHAEVIAGPEYLAKYKDHGEAAHFYGCVTELDEQVGRIQRLLEELDVDQNTIIFFCSDNGPEGKEASGRFAGTTAGYRGRKRALYEGGVRVPALVVWPGKVEPNSTTDAICSTLDYFPTIQSIVGFEMPDDRPLDGESLLPVLTGETTERQGPIPFRFNGGRSAWVSNGYKLVMPQRELYDLKGDPFETKNVADSNRERVEQMEADLIRFFESVARSHAGEDYYQSTYSPTNKWKPLKLETGRN